MTKTDEYAIDGKRAAKNDTLIWDGNGCCAGTDAQVKVGDTDFADVDGTYYVGNSATDTCCGNTWASARDLRWPAPPAPPVTLPLNTALAVDLAKKVADQSLTYAQILSGIQGIANTLIEEAKAGSAIATGVCSICFNDVRFVGGQWKHDDQKSTCSPPAILLSH